nr:Os01g0133832 [Ipomoea batatas]
MKATPRAAPAAIFSRVVQSNGVLPGIVVVAGNELGEDATVIAGPTGDANAPPPGRVGKTRERRGYFPNKPVPGDIEVLEIREVNAGNRTGEPVFLEAEGEQVSQMARTRRNLAGEIIMRQIKPVQPEQRRQRRRKLAGELIVRKKQQLQCHELRKAKNPELRQRSKLLKRAMELETFKNEARNPVVLARNASPPTRVGAGVPIPQLIISIRSGFEGQQRLSVWV